MVIRLLFVWDQTITNDKNDYQMDPLWRSSVQETLVMKLYMKIFAICRPFIT